MKDLTLEEIRKRIMRNEVSKFKEDIVRAKDEKCFVCNYDFVPLLEVHHIIPLKKGGDNDLSNLVVLCSNCHKMVHYFSTDKSFKNEFDTDNWFDNNLPKALKGKIIELTLKSVGVKVEGGKIVD